MTTRVLLSGCLFAIASASAQPVTVPMLGPRFKQTRERAEVMLGRRNGSTPPPDANVNLFQTSSAPTTSPVNPSPEPDPVGSDEALLAEALAVLTKGGGGLVDREGRLMLTVGPTSYRQGDSLPVQVRNRKIDLRITRITSNSVTLTLNQSEVVWSFSPVRGTG